MQLTIEIDDDMVIQSEDEIEFYEMWADRDIDPLTYAKELRKCRQIDEWNKEQCQIIKLS